MKVRVKTLEEIVNLDSVEKIKVNDDGVIREIGFKSGVIFGNVNNWLHKFGKIINVTLSTNKLFDYYDGDISYKKEWVEWIDDSCGPKLEEMSIFELAQSICYHAEAIKKAIKEGDDV